MKKLGVFIFFLLLIGSTTNVRAKTALTTSPKPTRPAAYEEAQKNRQEKKELLDQKKEELRNRIQERKASMEARLSDVKKQRINAYWQKLYTRLTAHILRLEKLIVRIDARIAKIEEGAEGAQVQLNEARELLEVAKVKLEDANGMIDEVLASDNPKAAFEKVRENVVDIREDLKEIHRLLVHTIGEIKGLRVGQGTNVTPTGTVSPTPTAVVTNTPTIIVTSTPTETPIASPTL